MPPLTLEEMQYEIILREKEREQAANKEAAFLLLLASGDSSTVGERHSSEDPR